MINYTWKIKTLDTFLDIDGLSRVIFSAHWSLTGESNGTIHTIEGHEYFKKPDPTSFINYKDLKETDIASWVETSLGSRLDDIKRDMEIELLRKQGKVVNLPKPWLLDPDLAPE